MDATARDAAVVETLQRVVAANPRWGFWKCYDRLRLDGHGWNHKRVYRVYHALRGLRDPLLVVMDGAPRLVKAVKRVWPRAYQQRCLAHKMRNIIAKLRHLMQGKMKDLVTQVFQAPSHAAGLKRGRDLIANFKDRYPAAMECLERDLEECVICLRFPEAHHRRIRTTTRVERLNGENRRRTKVIPRFPTERSCLTLLYASLTIASKLWRVIPMSATMLRQLTQLRTETMPMKEEAVA